MKTDGEIQDLLQQVLAQVSTDEAAVSYWSSQSLATRFAENAITQNLSNAEEGLRLHVANGRRHGSSVTNRLDPAALQELVSRATDIAANSPEDPETMPVLGPQAYPQTPPRFAPEIADLSPGDLARDIANAIAPAESAGYHASGLHTASTHAGGFATSRGLFATDRSTSLSFSMTAHGRAGSGSASSQSHTADLDIAAISEKAFRDARDAQDPQPIAPGDYTVIFEPDAVANLLAFLFWSLDARDAEEGTTPLAGQLGRRLFSEQVNLTTELTDPDIPACPHGEDWLPARHTAWIERGVVKRLYHDRFWAAQCQTHPDSSLYPLFLDGSEQSTADLVARCDRGLLVKHLWYIRYVDQKELLLTGMTRDGLFLVEDGKIAGPVKNLRFNESPIVFLQNVIARGRPERVGGLKVPPVMSAGFTFSSTTESV